MRPILDRRVIMSKKNVFVGGNNRRVRIRTAEIELRYGTFNKNWTLCWCGEKFMIHSWSLQPSYFKVCYVATAKVELIFPIPWSVHTPRCRRLCFANTLLRVGACVAPCRTDARPFMSCCTASIIFIVVFRSFY